MNQEIALSLGKCELQFPEETIVFLQGYNWPGNIRQLRNVVEWLHIMSNDNDTLVSIDKLPQDLAGNKIDITLGNEQIITQPLKSARDIFEKEYLRAQLSRFSGNISKTADFVGMERTALHRKLKILKIANE
jgi:two-component system nitrogen regulation response regulator NtrX